MKRIFRVFVPTIILAALVLLFVGCPEDIEKKSYIGTWEYIEYYGGGPPPEVDDMRIVFNLTENTWESIMYMYDGASWVAWIGSKGTMTVAGTTATATLTHVSVPPDGYPGWYDYTYWDYYYYYYIWNGFYNYTLYSYYGTTSIDMELEVSADGDTLFVTLPGGTVAYIRI
jgi:hypothetical protein